MRLAGTRGCLSALWACGHYSGHAGRHFHRGIPALLQLGVGRARVQSRVGPLCQQLVPLYERGHSVGTFLGGQIQPGH